MPAAKRFLDQHGLTTDAAFLATVQGLVNAIPRSKMKGHGLTPRLGCWTPRHAVSALYRIPPEELEIETAEQDELF